MPSLNDVIEIAELLKSRPVVVAEERCVAVRNRNASCRKCADACPAGCIEVGQNSLELHADACVNCGACTTVCPTGALVGLDPVDEDLVADTVAAWKRCKASPSAGNGRDAVSAIPRPLTRSGLESHVGSEMSDTASRPFPADDNVPIVLACARAAAWKETDPALHGTVPCLGRVSEETLVALVKAGDGGSPVLLVDGKCATCRYRAVSPLIDEAVAGAETLLSAFAVPTAIERASAFPDAVRLGPGEHGSSLRGQERRSLLKDAKRFAGSAAKTAAEKAIADALHQGKPGEPTLRDRLKVNPHGALPTFPAARNLNILDALCELSEESGDAALGISEPAVGAEPEDARGRGMMGAAPRPSFDSSATIETRLFGNVGIDLSTCTGCGMCAMFCPTGALRFSEVAEPAEPDMRYLEFQAADCTQCNLCADVCLHDSVTVSPRVALADLLDFEPRLLLTPKPRKSVDIFKQSRRARSNDHGRS